MTLPAPVTLTPDDAAYPVRLRLVLGARAPERLTVVGDAALLRVPSLAIFCSSACVGEVILALYDLARGLRDAGVATVGGWHAPMERECRDFLVRGSQPMVWCPARGLGPTMRVPPIWRAPLAGGSLCIASPFAPDERRASAALGLTRNRCAAALAGAVCIAFAAPGGQTLRLATEVAAWGVPLLTLPSTANAPLVALGAQMLPVPEMVAWCQAHLVS